MGQGLDQLFRVIDDVDILTLADKPVILRIADPDRVLGDVVSIGLHRSGRTPSVMKRHILMDANGRGAFFGWTPRELSGISLERDAKAGRTGQPPKISVRVPSYVEVAVRAGLSAPFAFAQTVRLLIAGNIKGFQYRIVRLFDGLCTPSYQDWLRTPEREEPCPAPFPACDPEPIVSVVILGDPARADVTRRSLAEQTCPVLTEIRPEGQGADVAGKNDSSFVMFLTAGSTLEKDAIGSLLRPLLADSRLAAAYADEDVLSKGRRSHPFFKPAWNPPLAATGWLPVDGMLVRSAALPPGAIHLPESGAAIAEALTRFGPVVHIPRILLHRDKQRIPAQLAVPRQAAARTDVSVIIPTRDRADLLQACLEGLINRTRADDLDIIVIDNDSREPETFSLFDRYEGAGILRRIPMHGEFNFSRACNLGVEAARHELVLLLNNDVEPLESHWLDQLVAELDDPRIGASGALLLFPDGFVQHGGVTLGAGSVARHNFHFRHPGAGEDFGLLTQRQEMSAVTAACLLTRRSLWKQVGGMEEAHLPVAFNDVDYCLKLGEAGYGILWTPHARLLHRESVSRGADDTERKRARFAAEEKYMHERWSRILLSDPFYNPNLSLTVGDHALDAARADLSPRLSAMASLR